ncbi:MAG: 7-cyano-7-deazaguanine synthase QueC [Methanobacteriota archaeon]
MGREKAVVLLSGGLDSTVSACVAKREGLDIFALTIDYGQRHKRELGSAKKVAKAIGAKEHLVIRVDMAKIGGSALTDGELRVPKSGVKPGIPITYVPARNLVFLALAVSYAEKVGAAKVYIGANSVDYSGYPDCRPEFIEAFGVAANLGTKEGVEGAGMQIVAPLQTMNKGEIVKLGIKLGAPMHMTWSCYEGGKEACGKCDSCRLRLKGFAGAGAADPIVYINTRAR